MTFAKALTRYGKYLLWFILAFPSWQYLGEFFWPDRYYPEMMEKSGVLSMQLLVVTLAVSPAALLLKRFALSKQLALWLVRSRRYLGLAGFFYAVIHTALYIRQTYDFELIWLEAFTWAFGTGWLALLMLVPVAITSNGLSVRRLGKWWKRLQKLSYLVMILGFAHWLLLDFFIDNALVWIVMLLVAKTVQIMFRLTDRRQPTATEKIAT